MPYTYRLLRCGTGHECAKTVKFSACFTVKTACVGSGFPVRVRCARGAFLFLCGEGRFFFAQVYCFLYGVLPHLRMLSGVMGINR